MSKPVRLKTSLVVSALMNSEYPISEEASCKFCGDGPFQWVVIEHPTKDGLKISKWFLIQVIGDEFYQHRCPQMMLHEYGDKKGKINFKQLKFGGKK